jgi:Kef-type K+ transport system membrane component KefB
MESAVELPSSVHRTELLLFFALLQLSVIVLAARFFGNLSARFGNSRAVGEIVAGLVLGPSLFGLLWPAGFAYVFRSAPAEAMGILSQVGLILLLFQIGLEFDFSHLRASPSWRAVARIALLGEIFPFLLGFAFGQFSAPMIFPQGNALGYSLFCGTAFSITAVPVLGRIMLELRLQRTRLGAIVISAAAINDVVGWLLLAMVSALAVAQFAAGQFALQAGLLVVYVAGCWWLARPLLLRLIRRSGTPEGPLPLDLLGILLAVAFVSGMLTYRIGIFAIFGGFMIGVLLHDQRELAAAWRSKVGSFVEVFFVPIFFTYTGLRTEIGLLGDWQMWGWCLLLVALATLGKFGGCYWAARWAGLDAAEARAVGIMMNTRGLMELIVINVGYDLGVLPRSVFTMLVIMALLSTVVTTPALRRWLRARAVEELKQGDAAL